MLRFIPSLPAALSQFWACLVGFSCCVFLVGCGESAGDDALRRAPIVLAASSLTEALSEAADVFAAKGNAAPLLSFASSSVLARQVEYGAPADVFISADNAWMDRVESAGLVVADSRVPLLTNRLVLIAPIDSIERGGLSLASGDGLAEIVGAGRIAMGEVESVPAGRYAKRLLFNLGLWDGLQSQIVPTENVRGALALVERGEVEFGLVYASDALASKRVKLIHEFAPEFQPEIIYPIGILKAGDSPLKSNFFAFLISDEAANIFARHGFGIVK